MNVPDGKRIVMTFVSEKSADKRLRWAVNVVFDGGSKPGSNLPIFAENADGSVIESGVFEFAGKLIPIENGTGHISYDDFIAGKHEKGVWLKRKGGVPVAGLLTFA